MAKTSLSLEEQLNDLQRRFQLLEGERKATNESEKVAINQNRDAVAQLKAENKVLRKKIADTRNMKPVSMEKQLQDAVSEVQASQRKLDLLKAENSKRHAALEELDRKFQDILLSSTSTDESSPHARQIRVLENRLDKAMIKYNEAQSISKTYDAIVKKLMKERIGFDKQLESVSQILKVKEHDHEEMVALSRDAFQAKEAAQAELHSFEKAVTEERSQREKEIQEKKVLVQHRVEANQRFEHQQGRILKRRQELDHADDTRLKDVLFSPNKTSTPRGTPRGTVGEEQRLSDFEEAFDKIKDATGVGDVNEVQEIIQRFLAQEDTQENLMNLTKENQARIDQLSEERRPWKSQVEGLKFAIGGNVGRRQIIDDFEAQLSRVTERFERNRGKFERSAKVLINMKAGIEHLMERLSVVQFEDDPEMEQTNRQTEDMLVKFENKLLKLMGVIQQMDVADCSGKSLAFDEGRYEEKQLKKSQSDVRIGRGNMDQDDSSTENLEEEMDEDVWDRKHVKYSSERIVEKQQSKRKKVKSKKREV